MRAEMDEAGLLEVDFGDANLRGAELTEADLRDANLEGADLRDALLKDALVEDEQLRRASSLAGATLPDGTKLEKQGWREAFEAWCRAHD